MNSSTQQDHVGRAIAWLLLGVTGGLGLDLCAKEILRTYSLSEFILAERVCCPFLHFELILKPYNRGVALKIAGNDEVKLFLKNMIGSE